MSVPDPGTPLQRILLTGAHGNIGWALRPALRETHLLRVSDLQPTPDLQPQEEDFPLDLQDFDLLLQAMHGVDGVVHLGGIAQEADFRDILAVNILGTQHVFEAARLCGVKRVLFASSNHAVGFHPLGPLLDGSEDLRPDTFYGVSKCFGENLGRLYHDKFGLEVVCLRIGSFLEKPTDPRHLSTWISPADMVALILACLQHPGVGFEVVYGISGNTRSFADNQRAFQLGYVPQDNAEDFAAEVLAKHGTTEVACPFVGGPFTDVDHLGKQPKG